MTKSTRPKRPYRKNLGAAIEHWPVADRAAWEAALRPTSPTRAGGGAARWSSASRDKSRRAYSLFLGCLVRLEPDALEAPIREKICDHRVERFIEWLDSVGYSVASKAFFLGGLRDFIRVTTGEGKSGLSKYVCKLDAMVTPRRPKEFVDPAEIRRRALDAMDYSDKQSGSDPLEAAAGFRDALMVAILVETVVRRENLCSIRIGVHLKENGPHYVLSFEAGEMKGKRDTCKPLSDDVSRCINRYLEAHRLHLLDADPNACANDRLWVSTRGKPLSGTAVHRIVTRWFEQHHGVWLWPHGARDIAGTYCIHKAAHLPHLTAAVLDHTDPETARRWYQHAPSVFAFDAYAGLVASLKGGGEGSK